MPAADLARSITRVTGVVGVAVLTLAGCSWTDPAPANGAATPVSPPSELPTQSQPSSEPPTDPTSVPAPTTTPEPSTTPDPPAATGPTTTGPPPEAVTLTALGDVMLARSVPDLIDAEGPAAPFAAVAEHLHSSDVVVGTLEAPLCDTGTAEPKSYPFRAPPDAVEALVEGGVDVVSLANNHVLDYGPDCLEQTVEVLEEHGIAHVGAGPDVESARSPAVVEVRGQRLGFLAYADVPDESNGYLMSTWEAGPDSAGVAWGHDEQVADDVERLAPEVDHVVVLPHWGWEGTTEPVEEQRLLAAAAHEAGATLVIGSHPHVLQPVEQDGPDSLTAYSLGNLLFPGFDGGYGGLATESVLLDITLGPQEIEEVDAVPVVLRDGLPEPVEDPDLASRILSQVLPEG